MASIRYDDSVVNNCVSSFKSLSYESNSTIDAIRNATSKIVSARGFNEYIGGINANSFSGIASECFSNLDNLVSNIQQIQVKVLAYSEDDDKIQVFLDKLDRSDFKKLDLSSIDSHIGLGRKIKNGFTSLAATLFTAGAGVVEGVCDFVETGADLVTLGKSAVSSIFTGTYDLVTGSDTTKKMWEETRAKVSEKKVENAFNNFYNNTEFGREVKNNAYLFDTVRGVSKGLGYSAGLIGVNIATGGLASGLGVGAAGSVGVGQLATTAGVMGFSNGTEEAWADGATLEKGLLYGAATGVWEGAQWAVGAKINQYGGIGDKVASGIFKGAKSGVATRVALDTVDSGLEGFVQPGLTMIYKDYEGNSLIDKYKNAFNQNGGWENVRNQAILGGIMSAGSELVDARKILKSAKGTETDTTDMTRAAGEDGGAEFRTDDMAASEDIFQREMMEYEMAASGDFSGSYRSTIDGEYIRTKDTEFNTNTSRTTIPDGSRKFMDGSYVPSGQRAGILCSTEPYYSGSSFNALLENRRKNLSGASYTRFKNASQIFASHGRKFNMNELKLILDHSEGNLTRIKSAITMSDPSIRGTDLDLLANDLAKKLFPSSVNPGYNIEKSITSIFIDDLQRGNRDTWLSGSVIFDDLYTYDRAMKNLHGVTTDIKMQRLNKLFGSGMLSNDLARKIVNSDGYPYTIFKLLETDSKIPSHLRKTLAESVSSRVFLETNAARVKAQYEILKGNYDHAAKLVSSSSSDFDVNTQLFKASEIFSQKAKRFVYYHLLDSAIESGISKSDALQLIKLIHGNAMSQVGTNSAKLSAEKLFDSNSDYYGHIPDLFKQFDSTRFSGSTVSPFMLRNYLNPDGRTFNTGSICKDFDKLMATKLFDSTKPNGVLFFDYSKSVEARELFRDSFDNVALNSSGKNLEALRVMCKILELEQSGKGVYVYNNAGFTCSHNSGKKINFDNQTIDGRTASTVFHETGHYLFKNVLGEQVPSGFDFVRSKAEKIMYSAANSQLLKDYKNNIMEAKYYADYKATKSLNASLRKRGFSSVDAYKKHLVEAYSRGTTAQNKDRLRYSTVRHGGMRGGQFDTEIGSKLDFDDALVCANIDYNSTKRKIADIISRNTMANYAKTSAVIDSLTMSKDSIWYGHTREYFETNSSFCYHELIADYVAFRVQGNNQAIGFLRQLFGSELINMLESTYQGMLK